MFKSTISALLFVAGLAACSGGGGSGGNGGGDGGGGDPAPTVQIGLLAGSIGGYGNLDGIGSVARFQAPNDVAVDATGNIYVADTGNHTIRKITPDGAVSTLAGAAAQPGNADGVGAAARFNRPQGLAVDAYGYLYVADAGNKTIRKISPTGAVSTLAGISGQLGYPNDVAINSGGDLYHRRQRRSQDHPGGRDQHLGRPGWGIQLLGWNRCRRAFLEPHQRGGR